jgi:hypothetical protein
MNAYLHHFSYEFRAGVRDKSLMFMNYLFPLAFFALAGALMSGINPGFNQYMIPAMSVFAVMSCFLLGMPSSLVASRDAGVLRSYRINGVPGWTSLAMPVAANVIHMAVITGTISLIGSVAMSAQLPDHVGVFVLGWVLGTAAGGARVGDRRFLQIGNAACTACVHPIDHPRRADDTARCALQGTHNDRETMAGDRNDERPPHLRRMVDLRSGARPRRSTRIRRRSHAL